MNVFRGNAGPRPARAGRTLSPGGRFAQRRRDPQAVLVGEQFILHQQTADAQPSLQASARVGAQLANGRKHRLDVGMERNLIVHGQFRAGSTAWRWRRRAARACSQR